MNGTDGDKGAMGKEGPTVSYKLYSYKLYSYVPTMTYVHVHFFYYNNLRTCTH